MFNRKTTALIAAGLLIFAMLASGGCLGGSDSSDVSKKWSLIGSISDEDRATLKEQAIELIAHKSGQTETTRSVLITKLASLTDEQKAEIKEMFAESKVGNIALLEPETAESITAFKEEIMGAENVNKAIVKENSLLLDKDGKKLEHARIRLYAMMKDSSGNVHSYGSVIRDSDATFPSVCRDDNISKYWVGENGKKTLRYNSKSGCYELVTYKLVPAETVTKESGEVVVITPEYVAEDNVKTLTDAGTDVEVEATDSAITAKLGGETYDCACVDTKNKGYQLLLQDDGTTKLYTCDLKASEDKSGEAPTEEEKITRVKYNTLKNFVEWVREKKPTTEELLAQAGSVKPKTRFEKFMAWAKDLLASDGIAFADAKQSAELFKVAASYTGNTSVHFTNLPDVRIAVNYSVLPMHEFSDTNIYGKKTGLFNDPDGGNDIYYVTQETIFTNALVEYYNRHWTEASNYWSRIAEANNDKHQYWPNSAECDEGYMSAYQVMNVLPNSQCKVVGLWMQPQTQNKTTTETVSHGYNIGTSANVGVSGKTGASAGLALSAGYTSSDSKTFSTNDIEFTTINCSSNVDGATAYIKVNHTLTTVPERDPDHHTKLNKPGALAKASYQPVQSFVWTLATADRDKYNAICCQSLCDVSGAYSSKSGTADPYYYTMRIGMNCDMSLPVPPRFCLDTDSVQFTNRFQRTADIAVYSQGKWVIDRSTIPSWLWLTVAGDIITEPESGELQIYEVDGKETKITIEATQNKTNKPRTAHIKLYRRDGTEGWDVREIYVYQSPN